MNTRVLLLSGVAVGLFLVGSSSQSPRLEARQPDEIKDLTQALTHASSPKPNECIRGLKAIPRFAPAKRDDEVARVIYRAFANGNSEVRVTVCQVAGDLRRIAPEYQFSFAPLLDSPEKELRMAALQSLMPRSGPFPQDEVEALVRLLKDKDPLARVYAYGQLREAGAREGAVPYQDRVAFASPALIEKLETESADEDPAAGNRNLLYLAVRALGKVGKRSPKAVPALLKVYGRFPAKTERDAAIRNAVVEALGEIGPFGDKSLPFLAKLIRDETLPIRERAEAALAAGKFGPLAADLVPEMVGLLKAELKQPAPPRGTGGAIMSAFVWLGEAAEPAVPYLLELAQGDALAEATARAIRTLGELGPVATKRATPVLGKLYFAKEEHRREHDLLNALVKFGDPAAAVALVALKEGDASRQYKAIRLLQNLGSSARVAIPELKRIAADERHPLQSHAESALQVIGK